MFHYIQSHYLFDLCKKCNWIDYTSENYLDLTEKGFHILTIENEIIRIRYQIRDVIQAFSPSWIHLIRRGRKEVKRYMTKNEIQCLNMARLFCNYDPRVIEWWDEFILNNFEENDRRNHIIGRKGELLSLRYEEKRTGTKAKLIALDVNFAGYDILSKISKTDSSPLLIEVKCSTLPWENAWFYLSRNEWEIFTLKESALIHLWTLKPQINFSIITYDELKTSIPHDHGSGRWTNTKIPFSISTPSIYKE